VTLLSVRLVPLLPMCDVQGSGVIETACSEAWRYGSDKL